MLVLLLMRITQHRLYGFFSDHGCEVNYLVGTILNTLTNRIEGNDTVVHLSARGQTAVIVWWNYLDGIYNLMLALKQFLDVGNYRYRQSVIKAIINVFCATQMFLFTYFPPLNRALGLNTPTGLAGVSFAVGTVGDLIAAWMDYCNAHKETTFEGWLDEKLKACHYAHLHGFETQTFLEELSARCRVFIHENPGKTAYIEELFDRRVNDGAEALIKELVCKDLPDMQKIHVEQNKELTHEAAQIYKTNRTLLAIKFFSMAGMVLLAAAGFLHDSKDNDYIILLIIGLALTTLVASYYVVANGERVADAVEDGFRFFTRKRQEIEPSVPLEVCQVQM